MSASQRLAGWAVLLPVGFLAGALAAWWIGPDEAYVGWLTAFWIVTKQEGAVAS